jgi:N-acetylglutamate synthase-like GNAT family acetyltransferase
LASIRPFLVYDRIACLAIFDSNAPDFIDPADRSDFTEFLSEPGQYVVAESEGTVVGCGGYYSRNSAARLTWGMVHRSHHRRGLGILLLRWRLQRIMAEPGVTTIECSTSQMTEGFYARCGFVTEDRLPEGYGPGLERVEMRMSVERAGEWAGLA